MSFLGLVIGRTSLARNTRESLAAGLGLPGIFNLFNGITIMVKYSNMEFICGKIQSQMALSNTTSMTVGKVVDLMS
jgi:hypothetical protein